MLQSLLSKETEFQLSLGHWDTGRWEGDMAVSRVTTKNNSDGNYGARATRTMEAGSQWQRRNERLFPQSAWSTMSYEHPCSQRAEQWETVTYNWPFCMESRIVSK